METRTLERGVLFNLGRPNMTVLIGYTQNRLTYTLQGNSGIIVFIAHKSMIIGLSNSLLGRKLVILFCCRGGGYIIICVYVCVGGCAHRP